MSGMSDTDTKAPSEKVGEKTLHLSSPKTLSLKRPVEHNTVRQSFSHGRTKQVVVETVKRRAGPGPAAKEANRSCPDGLGCALCSWRRCLRQPGRTGP